MKALPLILICIFFSLSSCRSKSIDSGIDTLHATDFVSMILGGGDVLLDGKKIIGDIHLYQCGNKILQNKGLSRTTINSSFVFKNCTFENNIFGFSDTSNFAWNSIVFNESFCFINCTFKKSVDLRSSVFRGSLSFQDCFFEDELRLTQAYFHDGLFLNNSVFQGLLSMQNSLSIGRFDATNIKCYGGYICQGSTFFLDVIFNNAIFEKSMNMGISVFHAGLFLNYAISSVACNLSNSDFRGRLELIGANMPVLDLHRSYVYRVPVCSKITISDHCDLNEIIFFQDASLPDCLVKK